MQIIISHVNTDFDAFASMIAANKLYPDAQLVISDKQDNQVRRFLNIYRDQFNLIQDNEVDWDKVTQMILVDVASFNRIGHFSKNINPNTMHITIYDHHPADKNDVKKDSGVIEKVGATVTLLIEEIRKRNIEISPFEATVFGLGIYSDTGAFTFKSTTVREFRAATYLMEQGMSLEMVQQFSEETINTKQQALLDRLFVEAETFNMDGIEVVISKCYEDQFISDLSTLTAKLLEIRGADAAISVVGMKNNVFVVGRARSERISLRPILQKLGGGGHNHAGSARVKNGDYLTVYRTIINNLESILKPAITATDIMTKPVKTISPETTIEKAGQLMYRYGHSGYPVVENGELVGIITRRDLDKANHHGLGHAPVKAYMTTNMITIDTRATLEEIQQMIIEHNIGRLPVISNNKLIGIISRTNIIEAIHRTTLPDKAKEEKSDQIKENIKTEMKQNLPVKTYSILTDIGKVANKQNLSVYLVGGIVRDLFLNVQNDDIDIVVEGDGISFVKKLQDEYGGEVLTHENFGTATWIHPPNQEVDIASSRLEYYETPASLPHVELSTLKEDLERRDFTINAMAIYLNENKFGTVIDPFSGQADLNKKRIKVLHNISFVEDPTRIFRAIRFEARFDFLMDKQTEKLALHSIDKVNDLSVDRIINEMKIIFSEIDSVKAIKRLYELKFWQQFGVNGDQKQTSCDRLNKLQKLYNQYKTNLFLSDINWFNFFIIPFYDHHLEAAEQFAITKRNITLLREIRLLKQTNWNGLDKIVNIHRQLKDISTEAILFISAVQNIAHQEHILTYLHKRNNLKRYITGDHLLKLGLKPGPIYSNVFYKLELAQLIGQVTSYDEALDWVKQYVLVNK